MAEINGMLEVEARLTQWASYKIRIMNGDVGWPSKNLIVSLGEGRGARFPTTGVCLILKFDHSQQMDGWVRAMGAQLPDLEDAITIYYTTRLSTGDVAKLLGVSRRTLLTRVHDAKLWLCGRLNAALEVKNRSWISNDTPKL